MFRQDVSDIRNFHLENNSATWGETACVISCVLDLIEQLRCVYYSPYEVRDISKRLYQEEAIDKDFYVTWLRTFRHFRLDIDISFEDKDYICKENEYEILELKRPGHTHFVRGDGSGHYTWDSLGIRPQQKEYKINSKRIIRILGGF